MAPCAQDVRGGEGNEVASGLASPEAQQAQSSAGLDVQAPSQMAVITTKSAHGLDSAVSPERPLRSRVPPAPAPRLNGLTEARLQVPRPQGSSAAPSPPQALPLTPAAANTPPVDLADGSPADAIATPFDNVLSVLDRIRQRPHTPWTAAAGGAAARQPYSPVQYPTASHASTGPHGSGRPVHESPYAAPQRRQPSRLAPYSTTRALPLPDLGRNGPSGSMFLGQPTEQPPAQSQPPQQPPGSVFAQTAGTPLGTSRFARCGLRSPPDSSSVSGCTALHLRRLRNEQPGRLM